jgi:hypothetical protein
VIGSRLTARCETRASIPLDAVAAHAKRQYGSCKLRRPLSRFRSSPVTSASRLEPTECFNPVAVVMRAEALSRKEGHVGAIAFSRIGDPATGDFSDAKVIRKFGDVPDDLSTL